MPKASTLGSSRTRAACLGVISAGLGLATSSFAQQAPKHFGAEDIKTIIETSANQPRFNRDFKGQTFQATLPLRIITDRYMAHGTYLAKFGRGYVNNVECKVKDRSTIDMMAGWDEGQMVKVTGKIRATGSNPTNVELNDCEFVPLPK